MVKQATFAGNSISQKAQIHKIKLLQNYKFYIIRKGKCTNFAKKCLHNLHDLPIHRKIFP